MCHVEVVMIVEDTSNLQIRKAQQEDEGTRAIMEILKNRLYEESITKHNVLFKIVNDKDVLVIPRAIQTEINRRVDKTRILHSKTERQS